MLGHKNQHFIPECYLKAWCDPGTPENQSPYVWMFAKDGTTVKNKSPHNIFHENNMYTIECANGERDLTLEHGLSELETRFSTLRNKKLKHRKNLTVDEHIILCAFVAAMHARTRAQREHTRQQWQRVFNMGEELKEWAKTATPEQKAAMGGLSSGGPSLTHEDVKELVVNPLQNALFPTISTLTPLLCMLDCAILETDNNPGFITSDNPCVWWDPEAYKRPPLYQAPALIYESIQIMLPISPHKIILLNRMGLNGYIPMEDMAVDDLNRITRFSAHEYFIVNINYKKDIWFDPGVEPDDSWEKMHSRNEKADQS